MFCSNCGKWIEDNSQFCPYCGQQQAGGRTQPSGKSSGSRGRKPSTAVVVLAAILLGFCCAVAILAITRRGGSDKKDGKEPAAIAETANTAEEPAVDDTAKTAEEPAVDDTAKIAEEPAVAKTAKASENPAGDAQESGENTDEARKADETVAAESDNARKGDEEQDAVEADAQDTDDAAAQAAGDPHTYSDLFTDSQIAEIRQSLGVPDNLDVTIHVGNAYYWDGGGMYLADVDFMNGEEYIAGASCQVYTSEIVKNIYMYSGT